MRLYNLLTSKARLRNFTPLLFLLMLAGGEVAEAKKVEEPSYHPLEDIYTRVQDFLQQDQMGEGVTVSVAPLDSRLRLKSCPTPLAVEYQRNRGRSGRVVVEVRCLGVTPWRIYVTANIRMVREVIVTASPVLKGERLDVNQLLLEEHDLSRLRQGYFESKAQLEGKFAKRAIRGGVVLTPQLLFIPNLINKGDQVSIQLQKGELRVQMKGIAMEDGHRDGKIRVKNSSSGKVVEGVVVAPGRVMVAE